VFLITLMHSRGSLLSAPKNAKAVNAASRVSQWNNNARRRGPSGIPAHGILCEVGVCRYHPLGNIYNKSVLEALNQGWRGLAVTLGHPESIGGPNELITYIHDW